MDGRTAAASRLVGRDAELRRLRSVVAGGAVSGEGLRVALVGGEAGIGKTRLVDEALATAPEQALVLRVQGDATRTSRPFGALAAALESAVRGWTEVPAPLSARREAVAALLAPVAPALGEPGSETSADVLERAAVDVLRHVTPDLGPLVVVADDLHWTDPETVTVLQQLVQGVAGLDDTVVLGTYRPDGLLARSPLSALLATAERRHDAISIRLEPLGLDDVADLAAQAFGADVPYRAVKALHHRSGGNPFFLEELVAVAGQSGVESIADLPLPWTVAELVRDTVLGLSDGERDVVETAAVLGHRVPFDLLARVTDLDERTLIDRLRSVVSAGLVVEDEVDVFAFRHALVRESIAGGLLGRERRRLHEAALDVLLAADVPDDAAIARHARGAGRIDVMLDAVRRAAVAKLARGTPYHALEFAEIGLTEAPDDPVLGKVATRAAWLVGALADAGRHGAQWASAAVARGDLVEESQARRVLARIAGDSGDEVAQRRELERLRVIAHQLPPGLDRAAAYADLAQAYMLAGRAAETLEYVAKATEEAEACGADVVRVQAAVERWSMATDVEPAEQVARMLDAVAEAEELGDHLTAARGLNNIVERVPFGDRRRVIERMRDNAERVGFTSLASYSYAEHLAELAAMSADRAELERWLADAWRWSRVGQCSYGDRVAWLRFYEALLATEAEDPDQVATYPFVERPARLPGHELAQLMVELQWAARRGDADAAHRALRSWPLSGRKLGCDARNVAIATEAALRAGVAPADVSAMVDRLVAAGAEPSPATDALLAAAAGDRVAAEAALAACDDDLERWIRAEVLLQLAALALDDDEPAAAVAHATDAAELLARWPGWRRERAEALLRRLERRHAHGDGHDLSGRELEVVALLADGLTNAQIAERLFIARKTAAVHVSNILAKLGMRSRTEVAAWAHRTGIATPAPPRAG